MSEVQVPDPNELPCEKCGKPTFYDGVIGGFAPCEHCGHEQPHTLLGSPLLPFLIYFGVCLLIEYFAPLGLPEPLNLLVYMGGLVLLFFIVCAFWKPPGAKSPQSSDRAEGKQDSEN